MQCNLCGNTRFGAQGARPTTRCLSCNSLERTRLLGMYISRLNLTAESRVLHLAPEFGIWQYIRQIVPPPRTTIWETSTRRVTPSRDNRYTRLT